MCSKLALSLALSLYPPPPSTHIDSSCGTNGMKKSSDGAHGTQSLFLNNTEHLASSANSLVRHTQTVQFYAFSCNSLFIHLKLRNKSTVKNNNIKMIE